MMDNKDSIVVDTECHLTEEPETLSRADIDHIIRIMKQKRLLTVDIVCQSLKLEVGLLQGMMQRGQAKDAHPDDRYAYLEVTAAAAQVHIDLVVQMQAGNPVIRDYLNSISQRYNSSWTNQLTDEMNLVYDAIRDVLRPDDYERCLEAIAAVSNRRPVVGIE